MARPVTAVKSADRALDILEYISRSMEAPSFGQLVSALGIPSSSLFYLLSTLTARGYLTQQTPKSGYQLGPALVGLAAVANGRISWAEIVRPLVDQVWSTLKETVSYFEPRGDEMECVLVKLSTQSLMSVHRVGQRTPLYSFSGGKVVLADRSDAELEAYLARTALTPFTPRTITDPEALRREIAEVRIDGCGMSREEHSLGTLGISIGLRTSSGLIGTMGVVVPAARFSESLGGEIRQVLRAAAADFASRTPQPAS